MSPDSPAESASDAENRAIVDVIVEIPQGQKNKYEMDHTTGRIRLDRTLFTSTAYPAEYGFIEGTVARDGEPLDALVLADEPTFPGCLISCRAIGMFQMIDEDGPDDKVLCVPVADPRHAEVQQLADVDQFRRLEIEHFFNVYKDLEPDKRVDDTRWVDLRAAVDEIDASRRRASLRGGDTFFDDGVK
jgi:inorganic pyrophosphatase